ncbi:MAG: tyrosine-type recombinase/integrase [Chromatiales bacterium]
MWRLCRARHNKHTCAAWLVGIGVPLAEVRDLLGHASVVVTERYAHLSPDNVRAAVAQLDQPMSRYGHAIESNMCRPASYATLRFCRACHIS